MTAILWMVMSAMPFSGATAHGDPRQLPFQPGEKLKFDLKWEFVKAGEATLQVLPAETVGDVRAYHFQMTAETTSFVDVFYKVRDRVDAFVDTDVTRSLLYKKKQREGKTHRDILVQFDWEKKLAQYTNFNKPKPPVELLPGTFDPLSAFYFARTVAPATGLDLQRPVTDGKDVVMGKVEFVRQERIEVNGKTYDTFLVEPEIQHIGGVFEKSDDAKIQVWLTADHRRIPVLIKSKVIVGSFRAELKSAVGLVPEPVKSFKEERPE